VEVIVFVRLVDGARVKEADGSIVGVIGGGESSVCGRRPMDATDAMRRMPMSS
jgi:hypothetical protein